MSPDESMEAALHAAGVTAKPRYTLREVSAILGAPLSTVRDLARNGKIKNTRPSLKCWWFYHDDVKNFLQKSSSVYILELSGTKNEP